MRGKSKIFAGAGLIVALPVLVWLAILLRSDQGDGQPDLAANAEVGQSAEIQALIDAKCKEGGVVELSGVYRTDTVVSIEDCTNLRLSGPAVLDGSHIPRQRDQRHLSIRRSTNIVVEDITVTGGRCERPCDSTTTLRPNERQHGFEIAASHDVELRDIAAVNVWGDGVYVTGKAFAKQETLPTGIVVRDAYFSNSGRQGIAAAGVDGMLVERVVVRLANRSVFDFEAESGGARNFTVRDSDVIDPDNAVVNISCKAGGTDVMLNKGPFLLSNIRIYGDPLSVNPYNCALPPDMVVLEDNADSLPLDQAPPRRPIPPGTEPAGNLPAGTPTTAAPGA